MSYYRKIADLLQELREVTGAECFINASDEEIIETMLTGLIIKARENKEAEGE